MSYNAKPHHAQSNELSTAYATADLLRLLVEAEQQERVYPWNPTAESFTDLDQSMDWEVAPGAASSFFANLDQQWQQIAPSPLSVLVQSLSARFANLPQFNLEAMAHRASEMAQSQLSRLDQLVGCAQELVPVWAVEDFQVVARPYASAMRGGSPDLPATADWDALSDLERSRIAVAIAHMMLKELQQT